MELQVYAWSRCPHCRAAIQWLKDHNIPFNYHEIEEQPKEVLDKVIEVNGGDDWVVPTLEYNGQWIPGEAFSSDRFEAHLKQLGVI